MNNDLALPARRMPVILDTDIGDDIDDTWALALLLENYRLWAVTHGDHGHPEAQSSVLFDCEAVHLAHTTRWLQMRRMGVRVDDEGYTREDVAARPFNVAMAWDDYGAFADDLTTRLPGPSAFCE